MSLSSRVAVAASLVLFASAGVAAATPPRTTSAALAAGALTAPCVPNRGAAHGVLPAPPLIDTWNLPASGGAAHAFTLNVDKYVPSASGTPPPPLYCYTDPQLAAQFVEAPTIRVKQGGAFTMTLVDRIPGPNATPPASAPDGCALLPYEHAIPPPGTAGYFDHTRVTPPPAPAASPGEMSMPGMLPNDTNFHTHGWHVDPNVDNVFKSLAHSKGGRCTYPFVVRADQPPGTYWYHAHLHGIAKEQVGGGLAGTLIVLPSDATAPKDHANRFPDTVVLVKNDNLPPQAAPAMLHGTLHSDTSGKRGEYAEILRGVRGTRAASAAPHAQAGPSDPWNPSPWPAGVAIGIPPTLCPPIKTVVRDPLEVNGLPMPATNDAVPAIPAVAQPLDRPTRYRIVDASSDTYLNVALLDRNNVRLDMIVVGRDGVPVNWDLDTGGFNPDPAVAWYVVRKNVFLAPSNRVDVVVDLRGAAPPLRFVSLPGNASNVGPGNVPYCTGPGGLPMPPRGILTIKTAPPRLGAAANVAAVPRTRAAGKTGADLFAQHAITGRRVLTFTQYDGYENFYVTQTGLEGASASPPPGYDFHEKPFWLAPYTGVPPTTPPMANHYLPTIRAPKNSVEEWTLINASPEIHAFHIHQLTFTALQSLFEPTDQRLFLDSIPLPAAAVVGVPPSPAPPGGWFPNLQPTKTVIKIDFRHVDRGVFVYHCHMLDHEDHGMMGIIEVY